MFSTLFQALSASKNSPSQPNQPSSETTPFDSTPTTPVEADIISPSSDNLPVVQKWELDPRTKQGQLPDKVQQTPPSDSTASANVVKLWEARNQPTGHELARLHVLATLPPHYTFVSPSPPQPQGESAAHPRKVCTPSK